jgi:sugar/nucleoside kinase (ribokinase family)
MDVYAAGNALVDQLVFVADETPSSLGVYRGSHTHVPFSKLDFLLQSLEPSVHVPGGISASVVRLLSRLGFDTGFSGCVGPDGSGSFLIESMEQAGVHLYLRTGENRTGIYAAMIHPDNCKTTLTQLGCAMDFRAADFDPRPWRKSRFAIWESYQFYNSTLTETALEKITEEGIPVVLELCDSKSVMDNKKMILKALEKEIFLVFGRSNELITLTGLPAAEAAEILATGDRNVVSWDETEVFLHSSEGKTYRTAIESDGTMDSTGSRQGFLAGLMSGLINERSWDMSLEYGMKMQNAVARNFGCDIQDEQIDELKASLR